jgi:surface antigen
VTRFIPSAPTVTEEPTDLTVSVGQSVGFSARFAGTPEPTIRWQVSLGNGPFQDISSTSAVLDLGPAAASSSGDRYRAVATNAGGVVASRPATLTVIGDNLLAGQGLAEGQYLTSSNGEFTLVMQNDGNLVEYNRYGRPLWASSTEGHAGAYLVLQASDGNLVIYSQSGQALWSGGPGGAGDTFQLAASGNLQVLSSGGGVAWETGALDHTLAPGEALLGGSAQVLTSPNQQYQLTMQGDGNLVLYGRGTGALWSSGTEGHPGAYAVLQASDGNLVIYGPSGQALWSSGTTTSPGDMLQIQPDGNLVIYSAGGNAVWATYTHQSTLAAGEALSGYWDQALYSPNGTFEFVMQGDGNLVYYNGAGQAMWASNTEGHPGAYLALQGTDGNLVIYSSSGQPLWNSGTEGHPGDYLAAQSDGNLVLYSPNGQALWATFTNGTGGGGGGGSGSALPPITGGTATAYQFYGYPYPNAPECTAGPHECIADAWAFFQGQCTSWVAYRMNQLNGFSFTNRYGGDGNWGNAEAWGGHASALGIPVDGSPGVGAVAWYSSGHVAYVEAVSSPTSVEISEMNYNFANGFRVEWISPGNHWPSAFIHIHDR